MTRATQIIPQEPSVYSRDGEVFTDSRFVGRRFTKRHDDVMKAIRRMHCSPEFRTRNFAETFVTEKVGITERPLRVYEMTKNGFIFLAMGFTGELAGAMKEAYIADFDAMEAEIARLRSAPVVNLDDPAFLRQALLGYTEKVLALEAKVSVQSEALAIAKPKTDFYDDFADAEGLVILTDIGRVLGVGPVNLLRLLVEKGVLFRTSKGAPLRARAEYMRRGWFVTKTKLIDDIARIQTFATPRGIQGVAEMLDRPVDLFGQRSTRSLQMTKH